YELSNQYLIPENGTLSLINHGQLIRRDDAGRVSQVSQAADEDRHGITYKRDATGELVGFKDDRNIEWQKQQNGKWEGTWKGKIQLDREENILVFTSPTEAEAVSIVSNDPAKSGDVAFDSSGNIIRFKDDRDRLWSWSTRGVWTCNLDGDFFS